MAAPTVSAVTPATLVAGAAPVAMAITGTNFAAGAVVSAPGLIVQGVVVASGTSITARVAAKNHATRGATVVTVLNTDAGTVNHAGPVVKTSDVNIGALDAIAANPGPGSVATASSAVGQSTETSHQALNPAFDTANEVGTESQQQAGLRDPEVPDPSAPNSGDNAGAQRDAAGQEMAPGDHSPQIPGKPVITSATPGATQATVTWTAPVDADGWDISSYLITATSSDGGTTRTKTVAGTVLTTTITTLSSAKHYTLTVAATNAAGTGPASTASASVLTT